MDKPTPNNMEQGSINILHGQRILLEQRLLGLQVRYEAVTISGHQRPEDS